jgi:hypothetical protein
MKHDLTAITKAGVTGGSGIIIWINNLLGWLPGVVSLIAGLLSIAWISLQIKYSIERKRSYDREQELRIRKLELENAEREAKKPPE